MDSSLCFFDGEACGGRELKMDVDWSTNLRFRECARSRPERDSRRVMRGREERARRRTSTFADHTLLHRSTGADSPLSLLLSLHFTHNLYTVTRQSWPPPTRSTGKSPLPSPLPAPRRALSLTPLSSRLAQIAANRAELLKLGLTPIARAPAVPVAPRPKKVVPSSTGLATPSPSPSAERTRPEGSRTSSRTKILAAQREGREVERVRLEELREVGDEEVGRDTEGMISQSRPSCEHLTALGLTPPHSQ